MPDRTLYTMTEAAEQLRASRRWLQEFIKKNPFYRLRGNRKVFTPSDITRLQDALPCPSTCRPPGARKHRITKSAEATLASAWTRAQEQLRNEKPRSASPPARRQSN